MKSIISCLRSIISCFGFVVLAGLGLAAGLVLFVAPAMADGPKQIKAPGAYPVTITKAGSYVLMENLVLPNATTRGIVIQKSNVTIDFNGFSLVSPGGGSKPGIDSTTVAGVANVVVKNGFVTGFGGDGLLLGDNSSVQNINVSRNGGDGIHVGSSSLVSGCVSYGNGGFGISFADNTGGYSNDIIDGNDTGTAENGTSVGGNVCNGSITCP